MSFREYFDSMTIPEQKDFAEEVGTSREYIKLFYLSDPVRKRARPKRIKELIAASGGELTKADLLDHFYDD